MSGGCSSCSLSSGALDPGPGGYSRPLRRPRACENGPSDLLDSASPHCSCLSAPGSGGSGTASKLRGLVIMRTEGVSRLLFLTAFSVGAAASAAAQAPAPPTRQAAIEQEQADKVKDLHPYVPGKAERVANRLDQILAGGAPRWHPFFENAYSGGGFALGLGYAHHVSPYNSIDLRGSYSIKGYKRAEVEFKAPRIFQRRGTLSVLGGWREATQVGFYGLGMTSSKDDRSNYSFQRPY